MDKKIKASEKALKKRLMVKIDANKPKLTDQSYAKASDINHIMKQYQHTGVLPSTREHLARYIDNTQVLPLEEAHAQIQEAQSLFLTIPSNIRKLMDNDPTKLVSFIQDPANTEILVKYGVLEQTVKEASKGDEKQDASLASPAGAKKKEETK